MPAGAVPKDGPSAGVAMAVALASLVSGKPVKADVAMTGEVTLTGQVLPVGGLKEKSLAAQSAGIKRIIVPERNEGDIAEIPEHERKGRRVRLRGPDRQGARGGAIAAPFRGICSANERSDEGVGEWQRAPAREPSRRVTQPVRRARILTCGV